MPWGNVQPRPEGMDHSTTGRCSGCSQIPVCTWLILKGVRPNPKLVLKASSFPEPYVCDRPHSLPFWLPSCLSSVLQCYLPCPALLSGQLTFSFPFLSLLTCPSSISPQHTLTPESPLASRSLTLYNFISMLVAGCSVPLPEQVRMFALVSFTVSLRQWSNSFFKQLSLIFIPSTENTRETLSRK